MPSDFDYSSLDFSKHVTGGGGKKPEDKPIPTTPLRPTAPKPPHGPLSLEAQDEYLEDTSEVPAAREGLASVRSASEGTVFDLGYQGRAMDHVRDGGEAFTHQDMFAGVARRRKIIGSLKWVVGIVALVAVLGAALFILQKFTPEETRANTIADPLGNFSVIHNDAMTKFSAAVEPADLSGEALDSAKPLTTSTGKAFTLPTSPQAVLKNAPCADLSFCLAGTFALDKAEGSKQWEVYYTQDVVNAPQLSEASEFYEPSLTSSAQKNYAGAAVTTVLFDGKPSRFVALVNKDGSGWLVRLYPDDKPVEMVKKF